MIRRELVILGAGPAGMAAAITAGRNGMRATVIDENATSGGQIFRQPPRSFATSDSPSDDENAARGTELREEFASLGDRIELLPGTTVWGYFPQRQNCHSKRTGMANDRNKATHSCAGCLRICTTLSWLDTPRCYDSWSRTVDGENNEDFAGQTGVGRRQRTILASRRSATTRCWS